MKACLVYGQPELSEEEFSSLLFNALKDEGIFDIVTTKENSEFVRRAFGEYQVTFHVTENSIPNMVTTMKEGSCVFWCSDKDPMFLEKICHVSGISLYNVNA